MRTSTALSLLWSACGGNRITLQSNQSISKQVLDLKISRNGVKRWVMKYFCEQNDFVVCACKRTFHSEGYPTAGSIEGRAKFIKLGSLPARRTSAVVC